MTEPKLVDLVGQNEIADRLGVKLGTVHMWRHRGLFPEPEWQLAIGPVWRWLTIEVWAIATGRLEEPAMHGKQWSWISRNVTRNFNMSSTDAPGRRPAMTPKYPDIEVQLVGGDSNAFVILGTVTRALHRAGVDRAEQEAFIDEATAGDYDHLLATAMAWVDVT